MPRSRTGKLLKASLPELAQWGREHPNEPKISTGTLNKQLGAVQAIAIWARDTASFPMMFIGRMRSRSARILYLTDDRKYVSRVAVRERLDGSSGRLTRLSELGGLTPRALAAANAAFVRVAIIVRSFLSKCRE